MKRPLSEEQRMRRKLNKTWHDMVKRCTNPNSKDYYRYGGRGITVCDKWLNDFEAFMQDMGDCPIGKSLDRIDNEQGYSPENCKWSTDAEQRANTRRSVYIEYDDKRMTIKQWGDYLNVSPAKIGDRYRKGWTAAQALGFEKRPPSEAQRQNALRATAASNERKRLIREGLKDPGWRVGQD